MQAMGSPTGLLRILALCTSRIMGRLTADPFLRTTDRSFVPRLSGLLRRGVARASPLSFLAASRGGQTMFPLAHCVSPCESPIARESPRFRSLTAAIANQILHFLGTRRVVGVLGAGRSPRRSCGEAIVMDTTPPQSRDSPRRTCLAIVLAAGESSRMRSARPKVLHELAGRSMLSHVLSSLVEAGAERTVVVAGPNHDAVMAEAKTIVRDAGIAIQKERLGTAHAVLAAREAIARGCDDLLVVFADTPLV